MGVQIAGTNRRIWSDMKQWVVKAQVNSKIKAKIRGKMYARIR